MTFHQPPNIFAASINLIVEDIEKSIVFYQGILGLKILQQFEQKVLLTADGYQPLLTLEQPEGVLPKESRRTGLYHFALLLPNRSELGVFLYHLLRTGYPIQGASYHLVSEAIYLQYPDGNGIEVYADRPSEEWEWTEGQVVMATEPIQAQDLLAQGKEKEWLGLPKDTIMGHIHLHVANLKDAGDFYVSGLGFNIVQKLSNHALFISTGEYHHHIGLNIWNGEGIPAPSKKSAGLHYFTIVLSDKETLNHIISTLSSMKVKIQEENKAYFVHDPSGNLIQLKVH
ncbi:VOC family protein [Heyndrickxia acidicola]|uniref:VOC family protein n=1 Tax=Heyndrickxia acidicola TaxID=209389 RepID=A0ABU6MCH8_9BACI|nr:VOC family protein [Heyndrickxia acidicola]MED1202375.1 VOC family protein [Heyndrickxia acidicola]